MKLNIWNWEKKKGKCPVPRPSGGFDKTIFLLQAANTARLQRSSTRMTKLLGLAHEILFPSPIRIGWECKEGKVIFKKSLYHIIHGNIIDWLTRPALNVNLDMLIEKTVQGSAENASKTHKGFYYNSPSIRKMSCLHLMEALLWGGTISIRKQCKHVARGVVCLGARLASSACVRDRRSVLRPIKK